MSEEIIKRSSDGRFVPGQSGNPSGKAQVVYSAKDYNQAARDEITPDEFRALTRKMYNFIMSTGSIRGYAVLADRLMGKPLPTEEPINTEGKEYIMHLLGIVRGDEEAEE